MGPKLAARLVTELKDKIVTPKTQDVQFINMGADEAPVSSLGEQTSLTEDVISALVNLGYQRIEAYQAASKVCAANADKSLSELIRLALKEFARKDI